jgi:hypothetical protein
VAENEHDEQQQDGQEEPSNGHQRQLGKMAALAAAGGATAFAAKKALESRTSGEGGPSSSRRTRARNSNGNAASRNTVALLSAALDHGWNAAKDTLTPIVGDASTRAGNYVAEHAPEVVRDVVIPRFIAGFERARSGGRGEDREPPEE